MVAVLDYDGGNTLSLMHALNRTGADYILSNKPEEIIRSDKLVIPGVGSAGSAMNDLRKRGLDDLIKNLKIPVLGICLGLQILCKWSEEDDTACLGVYDAQIRLFPKKDIVPHMGWNDFTKAEGKLFHGINKEAHCYFVHSYFAEVGEETTAITDYITPFAAAMEKDNFYATQFHPEKSSSTGEKILKNFLSL